MRALSFPEGCPVGEIIDVSSSSLENLAGIGVGSGWQAYFPEKQTQGLTINHAASKFARRLGWRTGTMIYGPAVFLGIDGNDNPINVPEALLHTAHSMKLLSMRMPQ